MASLYRLASIKGIFLKILRHYSDRDNALSAILLLAYGIASKANQDLRILPMEWMDQSETDEQALLQHGGVSTCYGPHYINSEQQKETISLPDIYFRIFYNARVSATSSSVIDGDKNVFIERVIHSDQEIFDYSAGQIKMHGMATAVVRLGDAEKIKKGIFLGGNGSFNYYHWVIEILSKFQFISALPSCYANYPLLISEDVELVSTFKETVDFFAENHSIVILKKENSYIVDNLIYIDSPSNLPFNLRNGNVFDLSYVRLNGGSINYIRTAVLAKIESCLCSNKLYSKHIYMGRKGGRRNYNESEIFMYLEKYGFEKVYMEDLSFQEQVAVVHNADWIVGPTGAAWTNLIFCQSGTKGLCWMAEEYGDFSAYSTIARLVGVDLRYVTYKTGAESTGELYCKNYTIDVSKIAMWLGYVSAEKMGYYSS